MEDCLESLGDAKVFTSLDFTAGFWQVPLRPADRKKTAFTTHAGIYRWLSMPFGLTNAPATFQRALDIILSGIKWQLCLVYLDDVIIFQSHSTRLPARRSPLTYQNLPKKPSRPLKTSAKRFSHRQSWPCQRPKAK